MKLTAEFTPQQIVALDSLLRVTPEDHEALNGGRREKDKSYDYPSCILHARLLLGMENRNAIIQLNTP